jgi:hypothetical protein
MSVRSRYSASSTSDVAADDGGLSLAASVSKRWANIPVGTKDARDLLIAGQLMVA